MKNNPCHGTIRFTLTLLLVYAGKSSWKKQVWDAGKNSSAGLQHRGIHTHTYTQTAQLAFHCQQQLLVHPPYLADMLLSFKWQLVGRNMAGLVGSLERPLTNRKKATCSACVNSFSSTW